MTREQVEFVIVAANKGEIDDEQVLTAIYYLIKHDIEPAVVEDLLWKLSKHYQEKARFFNNMRQDILFAFDKIEN